MLGLDFIRANRAAVEKAIADKVVTLDLDNLLSLDGDVRALKTEIEALRAERNAISARFKNAAPEERAELGRQAKEVGARAGELENDLAEKQGLLIELQMRIPTFRGTALRLGPTRASTPSSARKARRRNSASRRSTMLR